MTVHFYLPDAEDLATLARLDPDRDWQLMKRGQRWTVQTYLRLRAAGHPVALVDAPPQGGTVVFHARHKHELRRALRAGARVALVGIRGDRREALIADYEVLQNGRYADGRRRFFIPYWPQPGLVPRDPGRGASVHRAAFKGFDANIHPGLRGDAWTTFLRGLGIEWAVDAMAHAPSEEHGVTVDWHDYREVDLVVALRPDATGQHAGKPATKLYNAWLAGVPAILGPEHAFRELRRSDLDYLEVSSPEQAREAVSRLAGDARLYRAMVDNGRTRAGEFTVEALTARWAELLFSTIPRLEAARPAWTHRVPFGLRIASRWLARRLTLQPAR